MKTILKQILQIIGALAVVYGVLLAVTLVLVPRSELGSRLDASRARESLFLTEPKYVFLARGQLNTPVDKAILLGASNTLAGFRQAEVQALVPNQEVHNLAVGGSNITQIDQIADLVNEVQSTEARRHNTFVIGLWYGVFASDKARWHTPDRHAGDTDIDIERYRYGFYRRTEDGSAPVLPPGQLDTGVILIHPYLVLDRLARDVTSMARGWLTGRKPGMTNAQRNAIVLTEEQHLGYLAFWRGYMGDVDVLDDAPFQTLDKMVAKVLADGGRLVLVDMPLPRWHTEGSPLWRDYHRHIDPMLARYENEPGVTVLKMGAANANEDFHDEVHPKPRVSGQWAERLAAVLNKRTPQANKL